MDKVLTLVADPARADLTDALVNYVADALANAGAELGEPIWLADGIAADLPFEGISEKRACRAGHHHRLDCAAQSRAGRRKRLLVADMDSTMITAETLDEIAAKAGIGEEIAAITARAMRGELDFEEALNERVGRLKGVSADVLDQVLGELRFTAGGRELVGTMRAHGAHTVLVSGGFTFTTVFVRERLGFHDDRANRLVVENGALTGRVARPILGRDAKLATLREFCERLGIDAAEAVCVGDGANDLAMIEAAGMGVAYHAKPIVTDRARFRVNNGDLTALLYFQGYRASDFAA